MKPLPYMPFDLEGVVRFEMPDGNYVDIRRGRGDELLIHAGPMVRLVVRPLVTNELTVSVERH